MRIKLQCAPLFFIDVSMGSSNGVVPIRQQTIEWTTGDQIRSVHMASLCCLSGTQIHYQTKAELLWMRTPKQIEISLYVKCNWFYFSNIYRSGIFNAATILSIHGVENPWHPFQIRGISAWRSWKLCGLVYWISNYGCRKYETWWPIDIIASAVVELNHEYRAWMSNNIPQKNTDVNTCSCRKVSLSLLINWPEVALHTGPHYGIAVFNKCFHEKSLEITRFKKGFCVLLSIWNVSVKHYKCETTLMDMDK